MKLTQLTAAMTLAAVLAGPAIALDGTPQELSEAELDSIIASGVGLSLGAAAAASTSGASLETAASANVAANLPTTGIGGEVGVGLVSDLGSSIAADTGTSIGTSLGAGIGIGGSSLAAGAEVGLNLSLTGLLGGL